MNGVTLGYTMSVSNESGVTLPWRCPTSVLLHRNDQIATKIA